jgi:D-alanyl-D-alanine carboxypeptidase/D-alanyl-D-alanine-endopeptidase (penicillin-binding protein 4)
MKNLMALLFFMTFLSCAGTKDNKQRSKIASLSLPARIEELINQSDPNVNIGIKIVSLSDNRVLYEQNADRHFVPASTIKLATIAAALHYLGPNYRFDTHLYTDKINHKNNTIKNIYIQGSGDPSLMDHDLVNLARELKQQKIKKISGNIYIDDYVFDHLLLSNSAMEGDRKFGYGAPVCGLNLNYNRLLIKTVPAHKTELLAHAIVKPVTNYIKVSSRAQTKNNANNNLKISVEHNKQEKSWEQVDDSLCAGDHVYINGSIAAKASASYSLLAIKDPAILAGNFFKEQLELLGIEIDSKIMRKKIPADALKLSSHQSSALSAMLIDFTKISNNIAMDTLVKAIAAYHGEKPATFSGGLKYINNFLKEEVGISAGSLIAADGAGTSRYNLITPNQMVMLLKYAANRFTMGPEFMAAMPLAGEGTLSSRVKNPRLAGNIRAKTGSMSGISALAGYFLGEHGQRYAFAIMMNGFIGNSSKYIELQNNILSTLSSPISSTHIASSLEKKY